MFCVCVDQLLMSPQKALECIGTELQKQYERWQPRARYKHCLDPTLDEVKKLCMQLRKSAKVMWQKLSNKNETKKKKQQHTIISCLFKLNLQYSA